MLTPIFAQNQSLMHNDLFEHFSRKSREDRVLPVPEGFKETQKQFEAGGKHIHKVMDKEKDRLAEQLFPKKDTD